MEGKKLISATDTQYSSVLLQSLNEQRGHGLFCDVTVIVEDRKFRAHRNILSASSTYFHQLFSVAGQVVELSFVRAEIFAEILNYIYSSKIISVRSDLLDELIKSGQQLGVKFIADLGIAPSEEKNVPSEVKDGASETSSPSQRDAETQVPLIRPESQEATDGMPVITQSFSLHGIEYETTKITVSDSDDEDDDVIFCSEIVPPKECTKDKNAASQNQPCSSPAGASDQKTCAGGGSPCLTNTTAAQNLTLSASQLNPNQTQSGAESLVSATPQHFTPNIIVLNKPLLNSSLGASSLHQTHVTPTINLLEENQQPSNKSSLTEVETTAVDDEEVVEDDVDIISSSSPGSVSSSSLVQQSSVPKAATTEGSGVQKKQVVTFPQESFAKPGEFKIKISDVLSGNNKEFNSGIASKNVADGQKIITLDTAAEIGGLSTGCKVYANIGEDTYDIVIPVKGDSEEGEAKPEDTPRTSGDESSNRKRMKVKHDDHYELIVDGRVYYICIVCKRSYACLTSLRRHFNVHSWEKKYPCRYCDKVFALAEYRTKHELHHTGERRYQCLTCGKTFINYQITVSHIRSVHSQDPSGDTKLYRLHPCRSLQIRQYAYISDRPSSIPGMNEGGIVYRVGSGKDGTEGAAPNSPAKQISWDDIFVPPGNETMFKQNPSEGSTEFEFVIPESY
ncbi:transcriptional regulator Kaiso [Chiroxiphia lanceolata]|uniref:transcriptional regulator Kaiso n=1 Tax=Chiroxiphia lanceolata TaxID=296741 RepID=UPI0013CF05B1|nr:transcriptional regulator Kaiso [Chiroxiphia lanceolata]XP_032557606.1 transcriptional regulator Kaiso [Chiroxiphia lanceolata]XP_032557607.1 transcriptional regulator Kaiso [Chiroxiphia lanceolata]XP_032557608.1 transcriptional regulator Kaiso [Chiroxiphia lanceolata]